VGGFRLGAALAGIGISFFVARLEDVRLYASDGAFAAHVQGTPHSQSPGGTAEVLFRQLVGLLSRNRVKNIHNRAGSDPRDKR
jgi:hypothetical protein